MSAIVGEIEGYIALRGLGVGEIGQLAVVVHIVGTCQERVGLNVIASCLCRSRKSDSQEEQR